MLQVLRVSEFVCGNLNDDPPSKRYIQLEKRLIVCHLFAITFQLPPNNNFFDLAVVLRATIFGIWFWTEYNFSNLTVFFTFMFNRSKLETMKLFYILAFKMKCLFSTSRIYYHLPDSVLFLCAKSPLYTFWVVSVLKLPWYCRCTKKILD